MEPKIIAQRGTNDFMVDAGRGDGFGLIDVELARVYDRAGDSLSEPAPIAVLSGRGYWEEVAGDEPELEPVRSRVAALLG